jgi:hypothetical protein
MPAASDNANLAAFMAAFDQYRTWSKRALGPILEARGRALRWELWRQFKAIAKTARGLHTEIEDLGYRIRRRVDPATGKVPPNAGPEIARRIKSLRFLSVSFLYRAWRAAREGQEGRFASTSRASARIGEAIIRTRAGLDDPMVSLASFLTGVVIQNRAHGIGDRALRAQTADMLTYIARKQREDLAASLERVFTLSIAAP